MLDKIATPTQKSIVKPVRQIIRECWLVSSLRLAWSLAEQEMWLSEHVLASGPQPTRIGYFLLVLYGGMQSAFIEHVICRWGGHQWRGDGSYAGPDTGFECFTCHRCGYYWEHTYY